MPEIKFPAFVEFKLVTIPGGGQKVQSHHKQNGGRELIIVPDRGSLMPLTGKRIPFILGVVIYRGTKYTIATCFVPEEYSAIRKVAEKGLFCGAAKLPPKERRERRPKPTKTVTGRFVGQEVSSRANLDGPNVLRHVTQEMVAALRKQRELAMAPPPSRGAVVPNKKKQKRSKKG